MRWFSREGEFAFLSVGPIAQGVVAVGGIAHGVVAVGGIASAGVISIGLNAVGSVAALGLNAVGPVSLSLINGVGVLTLAGVNGWGWNGAAASAAALVPGAAVVVLALVLSAVYPGRRRDAGPPPLRRVVGRLEQGDVEASANLAQVSADGLTLEDRGLALECRVEPEVLAQARRLCAGARPVRVVARLTRTEERVRDHATERGYRVRAPERVRAAVACLDLALAPARGTWLPEDAEELQWVIAWSARLSAAAAAAAMLRAWL